LKPGRNDPCPCGSGKKFKQCCALRQAAPSVRRAPSAGEARAQRARLEAAISGEMRRLVQLLDLARYAEVEHRAAALLKNHPNFGFAWKVLGVALRMQGKRALPVLQRAAQLLPNDADAHSNLGNALREQGDTEAAVASHRRALEINPRRPDTLGNLGNALQDLRRFEEAVASYRAALEIDPAFVEVHNNLGNALQNLGRFEDAIESYGRALELKPTYAEAHNNLGNALRNLGRLEQAIGSYRRALELRPELAEAHNNLGNTLRDSKRLDEAIASYRRAIELRPNYAEGHNSLGTGLLDTGHFEEALASYRRALELRPRYAEAHSNLGNALRDLGQLPEALASFRRALEIQPNLAEAHCNLGHALLDLGQPDEALASYRHALALNPEYAAAHAAQAMALRLQGHALAAEASCRRALEIKPDRAPTLAFLAELRADRGDFRQAEELFRRALALDPDLPEAWAGIARCRTLTTQDADWLASTQRLAARSLPPRHASNLRYAIGKYFDEVGDFAAAFASYRQANELLKPRQGAHQRERAGAHFDEIVRRFDAQWLKRALSCALPSERPVLIVGMPRSGTTLAEQILASHPAVFGAGELTFWNIAAAAYQSAARQGDESLGLLPGFANGYQRRLEELSADALRVTDKMPANFANLGLIHALFPNARIIHMRRNPIDTCLSIYFHYLPGANSYAHDLADLAHYYREYLRLMQHWRATLGADAMLEVTYESLLDDQEGVSRRMVQFIGLEWDARCLEFHKIERSVTSSSKWQVRQPLNRAARQRRRNYEPFLGPLRELQALGAA
jgi:tetratricopeptide (TPR) repeat protein